MSPRRIVIPSRLHFGLYSFGHRDKRQYGGVGVMVDEPSTTLRATAAERFSAGGPRADRITQFAQLWAHANGYDSVPPVSIVEQSWAISSGAISSGAIEHAGLGSGTQLAMGVGALLHAMTGTPQPPAAELAKSVGRGLRSAVGAYGFALGGLIAECGKDPDEQPVSELDVRVEVPPAWRFVLLRPDTKQGVSGESEVRAFEELSPVDESRTKRLVDLARREMLPAAAVGDFTTFAESLYRFGYLAGECFAGIQGGPYNGPVLTHWIERLRAAGAVGVGQSSWGPTLFAVMPDLPAAERLVAQLLPETVASACEIRITAASRAGANIEEESTGAIPGEKPIAIAVVERDDCFVVGTRPEGVPLAGKWEFPGGKVESGELPALAAERECWEETGLSVRVGQLLQETPFAYEHSKVRLFFYRCRMIEGDLRAPWRWVKRQDLDPERFPEANRSLIALLRRLPG